MNAKIKDNTVVTSRFDAERNVIVFGAVGAGETILNLASLSDAVRQRATIHGLVQRISDRAAKSRDPKNGAIIATPAMKLASMAALVDHYNSGSEDWSPAREGGQVGLDTTLLAAVGEVAGKDVAVIRGLIEAGATKNGVTQRAYLAKLASSPRVAAVVDRMRAAQAPEIDAEGELNGLMG